jgi:hypothetical protein
VRYIPVPEAAQMSSYAAWYKQTYPDRAVALSAMSGDGLVTADNAGTVRLWETGVANLERSMQASLGTSPCRILISNPPSLVW